MAKRRNYSKEELRLRKLILESNLDHGDISNALGIGKAALSLRLKRGTRYQEIEDTINKLKKS